MSSSINEKIKKRDKINKKNLKIILNKENNYKDKYINKSISKKK